MAKSKALLGFEGSLVTAEELLTIERGYKNTPLRADQNEVNGLRGGAAVLMVASFEAFLKDMILEHLKELTVRPPPVAFASLPEKMRVSSVYYCLQTAMNGKPHEPKRDKKDRLIDIKVACALVAAEKIDPEVLTSTKSNPSLDTVKRLFKDLGVTDIFGKIQARFFKMGETRSSNVHRRQA